jgi:L-ribulokinase
MSRYALGIDYGTNSCRSLLVDLDNGAEVGSVVFNYPRGTGHPARSVRSTRGPPESAGLPRWPGSVITGALGAGEGGKSRIRSDQVVGIGIDTTGSTPIPSNQEGTPLGLLPEFKDNLNAHVWLWKDHTGPCRGRGDHRARPRDAPAISSRSAGAFTPANGGGAKSWRLRRSDPPFSRLRFLRRALRLDSRRAHRQHRSAHRSSAPFARRGTRPCLAASGAACRTRNSSPSSIPSPRRSARPTLFEAHTSDTKAGGLVRGMGEAKLGLKEGIPDLRRGLRCAHGRGRCGDQGRHLVKILGTSTCDLMIAARRSNRSARCRACAAS